jgi:hypothetical protein
MISIRYLVMPAEQGYVRLSLGTRGPAHAQDVFVESSQMEDGPWVPRTSIPPVGKGWVGHTLGVLRLLELLHGSVNGYVRGTEEDVKALQALLGRLS